MGSNQSHKHSPLRSGEEPGVRALPSISLINLLIKSLLLIVSFNLLFALLEPIPLLERFSGYNWLFPGRERLPFGEVQDKAYNLSLYQLDAMLLSHEIAARKPANEYRVIVIGDSSVWGFLLKPDQTLTACLNAFHLVAQDGKQVKFYNLGYPTITLTKDILILKKAMRFQPDMVVWLTTLESYPYPKQLSSPIIQHNPKPVRELIQAYDLKLSPQDPKLVDLSFWEQTIIGQRRPLADLLRLQLYGVLWAATGVDQFYPDTYDPPQADLKPDVSFYNLVPPTLQEDLLAFDVLSAGIELAGGRPVLLVNEPIYISQGVNSNIRYNFFYPRWAYDQYRSLLAEMSQSKHWTYLDLWDLIPSGEFTNSAIHMTPTGTDRLAIHIIREVELLLDKTYAP